MGVVQGSIPCKSIFLLSAIAGRVFLLVEWVGGWSGGSGAAVDGTAWEITGEHHLTSTPSEHQELSQGMQTVILFTVSSVL
jgi:hypothetical protein